jgi:Uma2 family endonuclease
METLTPHLALPHYAGLSMFKADFQRWTPDDEYLYEFNNGILEPASAMRLSEEYMLFNLETAFARTDGYRQGGRLRAGMEIWVTDEQMRRPDITFFSADQRQQLNQGQEVIPAFVVELLSESDGTRTYHKKVSEYFAAGVTVVWWVNPELELVYVFTSPKTIAVATGSDAVSAAPALPDLQITAAELFRR